MPSKIEWLNVPGYQAETWNPWIGCNPVSAGCENCWARREEDGRFRHLGRCFRPGWVPAPDEPYFWRGPVYQREYVLGKPLRWQKPRCVFVCPRSDLFHADIPFEQIDRAFAVMALCPQHLFLVLTKRAARMAEYFADRDRVLNGIADALIEHCGLPSQTATEAEAFRRAHRIGRREFDARRQQRVLLYNRWHREDRGANYDGIAGWPLPNVWLGTSVEDQETAEERIPQLLQTPAAKRFVSIEPMLGAVDVERFLAVNTGNFYRDLDKDQRRVRMDRLTGRSKSATIEGLDWVIAGGESGPGARPMHPAWPRKLRDDCKAAGVPYFFKQWGEYIPADQLPMINTLTFGGQVHHWPGNLSSLRVGKKTAGRLLDGAEYSEFPELQIANCKSQIEEARR